jgi:hypothetical protein
MDFDTLVHELEQGAEIIKTLVTGISQAEAQIKPNAGDWSILEVVGHLIDEERDDFRQRIDLTLNHPGQEWPPIHPSAWVTERAYNQRDLAQSLDEFLAERAKSLAFLKSLQNPDWTAMHRSDYGDRTAGQLLASWVAHDHLHMRQLVELRWRRVQTITAPYDIAYAGDW